MFGIALAMSLTYSCKNESKTNTDAQADTYKVNEAPFDYNVEQFADIKILRYQIPGWENLTLKEQKLVLTV